MEHIEMVEKLREKANISYEEAKAALEQTNWDLLDAMVFLEKEGKVHDERTARKASYSTKNEKKENDSYASYDIPRDTVGVGDLFSRFFKFLGKIIGKGNRNYLNVTKNGELMFGIPITIFVILVLIFAGLPFVLLIVGLFFGYEYSVSGPELGRDEVNNVMNKASEVADSIKEEFKDSAATKKQEKEAQKEAEAGEDA